jgi:hypothetical protein
MSDHTRYGPDGRRPTNHRTMKTKETTMPRDDYPWDLPEERSQPSDDPVWGEATDYIERTPNAETAAALEVSEWIPEALRSRNRWQDDPYSAPITDARDAEVLAASDWAASEASEWVPEGDAAYRAMIRARRDFELAVGLAEGTIVRDSEGKIRAGSGTRRELPKDELRSIWDAVHDGTVIRSAPAPQIKGGWR